VGARGGVFSPSCDASHLHPAPLQQHQAAQGRPGHHSSSAAGPLLFARANRLLLGSDLPRGSLGAAPALGRLGPRPAGGLRPSTHTRLLGSYAAAFGWWTDWLAVKQPRLLAELSRDAIAGCWHHGPVDSASAGQSYQLRTTYYCPIEGSRSSAGQRTTIASIGQSSIQDKDRASV